MFGWPIHSEEKLNPGRFQKTAHHTAKEAGPSQKIRIIPNKTKSILINFGEFYEARKTGTDQVSGMEQTGGAARETVCVKEVGFV